MSATTFRPSRYSGTSTNCWSTAARRSAARQNSTRPWSRPASGAPKTASQVGDGLLRLRVGLTPRVSMSRGRRASRPPGIEPAFEGGSGRSSRSRRVAHRRRTRRPPGGTRGEERTPPRGEPYSRASDIATGRVSLATGDALIDLDYEAEPEMLRPAAPGPRNRRVSASGRVNGARSDVAPRVPPSTGASMPPARPAPATSARASASGSREGEEASPAPPRVAPAFPARSSPRGADPTAERERASFF